MKLKQHLSFLHSSDIIICQTLEQVLRIQE